VNATVTLTGYDKVTELLRTLADVAEPLVAYARDIAGVPDTDPAVLAIHPLTPSQARAIAARAKVAVDRIGSITALRR
jgi:hypothetical protein